MSEPNEALRIVALVVLAAATLLVVIVGVASIVRPALRDRVGFGVPVLAGGCILGWLVYGYLW